MCRLLAESGEKLSDFAAETPGFGEKPPDLRLWRNPLDTPLP
jgi:hypothetical protein